MWRCRGRGTDVPGALRRGFDALPNDLKAAVIEHFRIRWQEPRLRNRGTSWMRAIPVLSARSGDCLLDWATGSERRFRSAASGSILSSRAKASASRDRTRWRPLSWAGAVGRGPAPANALERSVGVGGAGARIGYPTVRAVLTISLHLSSGSGSSRSAASFRPRFTEHRRCGRKSGRFRSAQATELRRLGHEASPRRARAVPKPTFLTPGLSVPDPSCQPFPRTNRKPWSRRATR